MPKKQSVRAVHDNYLPSLLDSLGLSERLNAGLLKCMVCGEVVTLESLQALVPSGNRIDVVCDKIPCYEEAVSSYEENSQ